LYLSERNKGDGLPPIRGHSVEQDGYYKRERDGVDPSDSGASWDGFRGGLSFWDFIRSEREKSKAVGRAESESTINKLRSEVKESKLKVLEILKERDSLKGEVKDRSDEASRLFRESHAEAEKYLARIGSLEKAVKASSSVVGSAPKPVTSIAVSQTSARELLSGMTQSIAKSSVINIKGTEAVAGTPSPARADVPFDSPVRARFVAMPPSPGSDIPVGLLHSSGDETIILPGSGEEGSPARIVEEVAPGEDVEPSRKKRKSRGTATTEAAETSSGVGETEGGESSEGEGRHRALFAKRDLPGWVAGSKSCPVCAKSFSSSTSCRAHYDVSHRGKGYLCHLCMRLQKSERDLKRHIKKRHEDPPTPCRFSEDYQFVRH